MKKYLLLAISLITLACLNAFGQESEWPKVIENEKGKIIIYQPQPESLQGDQLRARAAFSVTLTDANTPTFGALWANARVSTDRTTRMVYLIDAKVTDVRFPQGADSSKIEQLKQLIEQEIPKWDLKISLDALLASIEHNNPQAVTDLKTDAPDIIFTSSPSILVILDGEPKLNAIEKTSYKRVVNTPYLMVVDVLGKNYFLYANKQWFTSSSVDDAWSFVDHIPSDVYKIQQRLQEEQKKNGIADTGTSNLDSIGVNPNIIVRKHPSELLMTYGEPNFTPIQGTQLLYITNTKSNIFQNIAEQSYYVLISGRWYTSKSLQGPWSFIASDKLPSDFAKIPEGSDKDEVLASIAGTQAAKEAVMDAQVPQTAAVNRKEASCQVTYDGEPQFVEIPGTSLYYASNTSSSVIKDGNTFYVCENAVWFTGNTPSGPWAVATSVPRDVQKIPASSPVHNVKYVYIYDSTPDIVYVGYTPGYTGCYVYGPTIVYGTGWYYPGWYGTYYYPRPMTYGFNLHYNPWCGWSVGYSVSFGGGYGGWYGPYYRPPYYYHPYGGYYGYGPRPGYRPPPGRPVYYGPRNVNIYNNHPRGVQPTMPVRPGNYQGPRPGGGNMGRPSFNEPRTPDMRNNVFADPNGNVFRDRGNSKWQQNTGGDWKNIQRQNPGLPNNLNQQEFNRNRGDMRTNNFNNFQGPRGGGFGGGRPNIRR